LPPNQNSLHTFNPTLKKEKNYLPLPLKTFITIPYNLNKIKKLNLFIKKKKKKKGVCRPLKEKEKVLYKKVKQRNNKIKIK
jgi:hypothetical protein